MTILNVDTQNFIKENMNFDVALVSNDVGMGSVVMCITQSLGNRIEDVYSLFTIGDKTYIRMFKEHLRTHELLEQRTFEVINPNGVINGKGVLAAAKHVMF